MQDYAPIIHVAETTSTNDYLADRWRTRSLPPFTAVLTDFQTAGRGRLARQWLAPRRTSLLMSALIPADVHDLTWVPLLAGLSVAETLAPLLPHADVELKWPNDVLVNGRKVAGILTEFLGHKDGSSWVAVGIGVNLSQTPEQLPPVPSTSLEIEGAALTTPTSLAFHIMETLRKALGSDEARQAYAQRCISARSDVAVTLPDGTAIRGRGVDIDLRGALVIRDENGNLRSIEAGDVMLIADAPAAIVDHDGAWTAGAIS